MRLAIPENEASVRELARSPQSAAHPVGWKSLVELGHREVAISAKCLSRFPHCQTQSVRFAMGIEGAIVGRSSLLTDPELRGFSIEKHWAGESALSLGPEAADA